MSPSSTQTLKYQTRVWMAIEDLSIIHDIALVGFLYLRSVQPLAAIFTDSVVIHLPDINHGT